MLQSQKQQAEDAVLLAHVQDMCRRNAWRRFTAFLDMRQYVMLQAHLPQGVYTFSGGYPEAERGVLCVHPADYPPELSEFPFRCLTITFRNADKLTHRDVLGCFMHQQIQRNTIGDILVAPGEIQCFVLDTVAPVIQEIQKIGRVGVQITDAEPFRAVFQQEWQEITGVVSSPRLDAVLKTALHMRRTDCHALILSGKVMLRYQEITKPDVCLKAGDIFSVRGYGKFRLQTVGVPNQKGRLHIVIQKYV